MRLSNAGKHLILSHYAISSRSNKPKSKNGQTPLFWLFGSFKNEFLWHLNDPSWSGNVVECWKTFSTITLCNIKSIQQTKVQKMAKNLFFGSLDHSKMNFCDIWMIFHDLVMLSNAGEHLVLSHYAISSPSNRPNSRKRQKTLIFGFFCINYANYAYFINYAWPLTMVKCWKTFCTIIIRNIKSYWGPKLKKMAKNLIFGSSDHSKRHFCDFWMIQHTRYHGQIVKTI